MIGEEANNQKLSERRVLAVVECLVKGVNKKQFKVVGHGEKKPIANNLTIDGRKLNRKVQFKVIEE